MTNQINDLQVESIYMDEFDGVEMVIDGNEWTVQLEGGKYKPSMGCLVFVNYEEVCDWDDYPNAADIISLAEKFAADDYKDNYSIVDTGFNCSINNISYYIHANKVSGEAVLVAEPHNYNDYVSPREAIKKFNDKESALEYFDGFKTGEHHDFNGLYSMLNDAQQQY